MKVNDYHGFKYAPFRRNIKELYESTDYVEINQRLDYFVEDEGIALITGPSGTGKTTIVRSLLKKTDEEILYIQNNELTLFEFYNCLGKMMEIPTNHCHMSQILMDINHRTKTYGMSGKKIVLIVDDVETLDSKIIRTLKYLSESDSERYSGIRIVLLGHSSFREKCKRERYMTLIGNITVNYECIGLSLNETKEYIRHRLREAGGSTEMIEDKYYATIYGYTEGRTQKINRYMSTLLLIMYKMEAKEVNNRILKMAQQEMEI